MNNKKTLIIAASAFVAILVVAGILYNKLGDNIKPDSLITEQSSTTGSESGNESENRTSAPNFTVTNKEGKEVKLSDFKGKPVVLNFWASWCGPCVGEMPVFEDTYKTNSDSIEFVMVNLTDGSRETVSTAKSFISNNDYTFPVYFDEKSSAASAYAVYSIPATYFIDKDGYVIAQAKGPLEAESLRRGIEMIKD